jgi:hypothetical protein
MKFPRRSFFFLFPLGPNLLADRKQKPN